MKRFASILLVFLIICSITGCRAASPQSSHPSRLIVAATIFPVYDIVKNIAGPDAEVILILPPGASEHSFEPTPQTIKSLADVRLIFAVGGFDAWADQLTANLEHAEHLTLDRGIHLRSGGHDHDDEFALPNDDPDHADPHYWLDVRNAMIMAQTITTELIRLDPVHTAAYQQRLLQYHGELVRTHQHIHDILDYLPRHEIITFHDAWRYFAAAYGLEIVATIEPTPGKEPSPADVRELTQAIVGQDRKVIFVEPQLSLDAVRPLIDDYNVQLHTIDPLGGVDGRSTYIQMMVYNAETIAQALR